MAMPNKQDPEIKVESSPSPPRRPRAPDLGRQAAPSPAPASNHRAEPASDVPHGSSGAGSAQGVAGSGLTQEQFNSLYSGPNRTNYMAGDMAGMFDGGHYWERNSRQTAAAQAPSSPHALGAMPFEKSKFYQANRSYAGVPTAHHMVPIQAPSQRKQVFDHMDYAPRKRAKTLGEGRKERIEKMMLPAQIRRTWWDPEVAPFENSDQVLNFTNRNEALSAVVGRNLGWMPPPNDDTVPTTDEERGKWVLRLFLAMKNREDLLDNAAEKRWKAVKGNEAAYFYDEEHMERVCWEIVHLAEMLHLHGPSILAIYDDDTLKNIKRDGALTFEQRMEYLIKMLCFFKAKCDAFMKGLGVEEIVACPFQKMCQSLQNLKQNRVRAEDIRAGRKARGRPVASEQEQDDDDNDTDVGLELAAAEPLVTQPTAQRAHDVPTKDVETKDRREQSVGMKGEHTRSVLPTDPHIKTEPTDSTALDVAVKAKLKRIAAMSAVGNASHGAEEPQPKRAHTD